MKLVRNHGSMAQLAAWSLAALLTSLVLLSSTLSGQAVQDAAPGVSAPLVEEDVQHDLSPPLRELAAHFVPSDTKPPGESEEIPGVAAYGLKTQREATRPVSTPLPAAPSGANPFRIVQSFDGISTAELRAKRYYVANFATDSSGAVGQNYFVETVNFAFAVFDKNGTLLAGPTPTSVFWSGFNAPCGPVNWSDVVVLYDRTAQRWFVSRFYQQNSNSPYYQCFAISQTDDPMGAYYRYAFLVSTTEFNDYPKFGIWPDAYYMTADRNKIYSGLGMFIIAFEREKMLRGGRARRIMFTLNNDNRLAGMLPADWDGVLPPPAGASDYLIRPTSTALGWYADTLELWQFHVNWYTPSASTLRRTDVLHPHAYSPPCIGNQSCVPQPGTTNALDPLAWGYVMYRLAYRNFGDHESLVLNHTVEVHDLGADLHVGIRWYELRKDGGSWSIYQQGDYAPDSDHRWIGSLAQDRYGNMALGYNVSGSRYPSIAFAGRLAQDPLGTLSQETTIQEGGGSQTGYIFWGDYSQLTLDPADDCTFWYVGAYQSSTHHDQAWATRIVAFRSEQCDRHRL